MRVNKRGSEWEEEGAITDEEVIRYFRVIRVSLGRRSEGDRGIGRRERNEKGEEGVREIKEEEGEREKRKERSERGQIDRQIKNIDTR